MSGRTDHGLGTFKPDSHNTFIGYAWVHVCVLMMHAWMLRCMYAWVITDIMIHLIDYYWHRKLCLHDV